jgi:aldehyde:ferredoxin oxidoreductase
MLLLGYAGTVLHVNLTNGRTCREPLNEELARKYLGGLGLGLALLFKHCRRGANPFEPYNPLILAVGPLAGTMTPAGGSGHVFVAKSPQTFGAGVARAFGHFGAELKRAGYDAVIIYGRADRPVYVWIDDYSVQILDASALWGKSPAETEEIIREELGDYRIRVASTGPAGERLVRFASIISDKTRAAGRTGLGAVMGSKNLKAIAVRGTGDVMVADVEGFKEHVKVLYGKMKNPTIERYKALGTISEISLYNALHALPSRNYSNAHFDDAEVMVEKLSKSFAVKANACNSCPIGCEHIYAVPYGPNKRVEARIEYGTLWAMGPNCGINRLDTIIEAVDLCNYYGLDAISTGVVVAFAMECYEKGILSAAELDFVKATFGSSEALIKLIHKIGKREGIGNILAEGVKLAAEKIGKGADKLAQHIKGVETVGYDLRALKAMALACAVSFRGDYTFNDLQAVNASNKPEIVKFVKDLEDQHAVMDSLMICKFSKQAYSGGYEDFAKLYMLVTGFETTSQEMMAAGERIINMARLFNIREGLRRADDHLPWKVMNVPIFDEGPTKEAYVNLQELNLMLDYYYAARGWTKEGTPAPEKLRELGLEEFANQVYAKAQMR